MNTVITIPKVMPVEPGSVAFIDLLIMKNILLTIVAAPLRLSVRMGPILLIFGSWSCFSHCCKRRIRTRPQNCIFENLMLYQKMNQHLNRMSGINWFEGDLGEQCERLISLPNFAKCH